MVDQDAQLVEGCRSGDNAALELLFRRHVDRVWRYAWFVTRSRESAGDIVQETFLRVARSVASFEGRSTFSTWLFTLTRSAAMEHLRRTRLEKRSLSQANVFRLVKPEAESPEDGGSGESREAVRRAIAELPGAQRDAVILCEMNGMSIADAAEALGWGHSRVKVTLFRARRKLRDLLKEHVAGERSGKRADET